MARLVRSLLPFPFGFVLMFTGTGGCTRSPAPSQVLLPTQLTVVAEQGTGEPVSLVLDLRRNSRDQLDVRVAPGLRLWDGKHLWEVSPTLDSRGNGLHVGDLKAGLGGDVPLFAAGPLRVVGMTRRDLWVELPNRATFRCELSRPLCKEGAVEPLPMSHPGPGAGFALTLAGGELKLRLPFADADVILLDRVTSLVGVHWVHETWLDHDALLDSTYRGRGTLTAVTRDITADGDLHDWTDAEPMVVDAPWQVESGGESWSGPRDASFSIAVSTSNTTPPTLCFAGRVRDDDPSPADALLLRVGDQPVVRVPLVLDSPPAATLSGAASATASVRAGWFSRAFEICPSGPVALPRVDGEIPFSATFEDYDGPEAGGGTTTRLSSAPTAGGAPGGALRIGG